MIPRRSLLPVVASGIFLLLATGAGPGHGETWPPGPSTAASLDASLEEILDLVRSGTAERAEKAARDLLARVEASSGCDSLEAARVIDVLVEVLWRSGRGRSPEALERARQAIAIKERVLGPDDPRVASSLIGEAHVLSERASYREARPLAERALEICVRTYGPDGAESARMHGELANLLAEADRAASEQHAREALRILEAAGVTDGLDLASSLNVLARRLVERGQYVEAEAMYVRAMRISETHGRSGDLLLAQCLHNLGYLHYETGEYEKARPELERALAIRRERGQRDRSIVTTAGNLALVEAALGYSMESRMGEAIALADEVLGPEHDVSAGMRVNLAIALGGDPVRARQLAEQAFAAFSRTLGPDNPRTLWALDILASVALNLGDLATAERQLEAANAGFEKAAGAPPHIVAHALRALAECRVRAGRVAEARDLEQRALSLLEARQGPESPILAAGLHDHAEFLRKIGDLEGARTAHERALRIKETTRGGRSETVARSLVALARLGLETGRLEEAKALSARALAILEPTDGPEKAAAHRVQAAALLASGEFRAALEPALRAEAISRRQLRTAVVGLPEREALGLAGRTEGGLDLALSAAVASRTPPAAARVLDALVRSRALVLDEMALRNRTIWASGSPGLQALVGTYVAARTRLANLAVRGEDERFPERSRKRLAAARAEKEAAERALSERSAGFRHGRETAAATLAEVAAALPSGSALVSFVRYPRTLPRPAGSRGRPVAPVDSYGAFVLRHGARAPALVPLGKARAIDENVTALRKALADASAPLGGPSGPPEKGYRSASAALRDTVWAPLEKHLSTARTVFVVPDGSLQLVSLAALPVGAGAYLVETGPRLHYLSAERDLVPAGPATGRGLLAVGAPDFDRVAAVQPLGPPASGAGTRAAATLRGVRPPCRGLGSLRFAPLPAARAELEEVTAVWRVATSPDSLAARQADRPAEPLVLTGEAAGERAFKAHAPGHRLLHLATHGFFLGGCSSPGDATAMSGGSGAAPVLAENPLLLSGLALAGANLGSTTPPGADDGILTAEEIAGLDLTGTEWVVLSACESGLGEPRPGEGLFGLRRAFQVAGARTLVTSLWAVEDEATGRFMKVLYEKRLGGRLSTVEAVHEASLECLRERRAAGQSPHPFFWAGFVAAGDWR